MNNFHDNIQGIAERKKTRIRWYNSLFGKIEKPTLEFKVKKGLLGKKISYPIPPFQLNYNTNFDMRVITQICNNSDISEFEKIELKFEIDLNIAFPLLLEKFYQSRLF